MIEVVKPKANDKHEVVCSHCNTLLRYEEEDVERACNEEGIICPNCYEWILIKTNPPFAFPDSFYQFNGNGNAVKLTDEETQTSVDRCIKQMKQSGEEWDMTLESTGDTLVLAWKNEEGIFCYVAKNYYEAIEFYD